MEFEDIINERYSVRHFSDKAVEQEKIDKIIEAGRIAPTAANFQPQKIFVINSEEGLKKIHKVCKMTYDAPLVLLVCADLDQSWKIRMDNEFDSADMDATIVGTYLMLEAWNLGIGSCWIRAFNSMDVSEEFNLPNNIKPMFILSLGYKAEDSTPNGKMHFNRKSIDEIVKYI